MSQKPKGRPVRKIVSDHFVPVEKVKNNSNRYFFKCNYYLASIEGRDDNHLKHLIDQKTCPKAPDRTRADVGGYLATKKGNQDLLSPSIAETSSLSESQGQTTVESRKRKNLLGYVDLPVTPEQTNRAHFKLLRFIIHANIPFSVAENWFFRHFLDKIRPSYQAPSRYVLSHSIMDSEVTRVQIEDIARLKDRKHLTYLLDGWEDKIRRSLYGSMVAEVNQHPVVLSLEDMTGHRGSADKLLEVSVKALERMEIGDGHNIIAATTDNPTVMQSFRRKFQAKFYWVIRVERGITPTGFVEEIDVLNRGSGSASGWSIDALLTSEGVASL